MNTQEAVTQLLNDIATLKVSLATKEKELLSHRDDLKKLLGAVEAGSGVKSQTKPGQGRPAGVRGENVTAGVLKYMSESATEGGPGVSRADLLKQFPGRDSAVQAAIRVHNLAGRIYNTTDHRWFYNSVQPSDTVDAAVAQQELDVNTTPSEQSANS